jgi:hypothetical protein
MGAWGISSSDSMIAQLEPKCYIMTQPSKVIASSCLAVAVMRCFGLMQ